LKKSESSNLKVILLTACTVSLGSIIETLGAMVTFGIKLMLK